MNRTVLHWLRRSLVVAAAVISTACKNEAPLGPQRQPVVPVDNAALPAARVSSANAGRVADLGSCQNLRPPEGSKLVFHVYATGVQIYHWNGSGWTFDGPDAVLSADAKGKSTVGIHYAGPTWESNSGGTVKGTVAQRCTPDPSAIQWLLLTAVSEGPGIFHRVTHIQRVNTVGGKEPTSAGSVTGEVARVPYTTEYYFYRAP